MPDSPFTTCQSIVAAVRANAAVEAYCLANFRKSLVAYIGIDPRNPPGEQSAPFFSIQPQQIGRTNEWTHREETYLCVVAVHCDSVTTDAGTTTYRGFDLISGLGDAVSEAVGRHVEVECVQQDQLQIEIAYPFYFAIWSIRLGKSLE